MRKTDDDIPKGKIEKQTLDALVLMCEGDLQEIAKMAQRAIDRTKNTTVKEVTFAVQEEKTKGDEFEKLTEKLDMLCLAQGNMEKKMEKMERGRSFYRNSRDSRDGRDRRSLSRERENICRSRERVGREADKGAGVIAGIEVAGMMTTNAHSASRRDMI